MGNAVPTRRLSREDALALVQSILQDGMLAHSESLKGELASNRMTMLDVNNVLRLGTVREEGTFHALSGTYRYKVETDRMCVVVVFGDENEMQVITGWRKS